MLLAPPGKKARNEGKNNFQEKKAKKDVRFGKQRLQIGSLIG